MPPRSKSSKTEWITCSLCERVFSSRDQTKHSEECNDDDNPNCILSHGYIDGKALHGSVCSVEATSDKLPSHCTGSVVFLHPSAMRLCGFSLAGPVIVKHQVALHVWPNAALPLAGVSFPSNVSKYGGAFQTGDVVTVKALSEPHYMATDVKLVSRDNKSLCVTPEFCSYVKHKENGRFIKSGNMLTVNYFGQPCSLCVLSVTGEYVASTFTCDTAELPVRNLAKDLEGLSIKKKRKKSATRACPQFYRISLNTRFTVVSEEHMDSPDGVVGKTSSSSSSLEDVGGLEKQKSQVMELIELQLRDGASIARRGLHLPKGVLLYGPTGTGKTLLAHSLARCSGANVVKLHGAEVWSKFYGESESKLAGVFREAKEQAPCILVIDDINILSPRREASGTDTEKRVVAALLSLFDDVFSGEKAVMVIATTNSPDDLDPALRRPGRLDREIEVGVPSAKERDDILQKLLRMVDHNLTVDDIVSIATKAHGFVGSDLSAVCKEAGVHALKRSVGNMTAVTKGDLEYGLQCVQPSAMREVALEVPQVTWSDIGGQSELKHKLRQAIEWPLLHPEAFSRLGIRPPRGLLMYGPPGCSKTMIAKALARESGINFIAIKGPELFSKWVGESERAVREVFRKARAAAPAIVFFDEIDALAGERGSGSSGGGEVSDRVLAQLLTEIDGVDALHDVTIVAATNRPDRIDKALLRPGRLDRIVYVPLPDAETRREIFTIQFRKTPTSPEVVVDDLVARTEGYSGAEVSAVCHEAALSAMQEDINIDSVHRRHFDHALKAVTPRITPDLIEFYQEYQQASGLHNI